MLTQMLNYCNI